MGRGRAGGEKGVSHGIIARTPRRSEGTTSLLTRGGVAPVPCLVAVHVADPPGAVEEPRGRERGGALDDHDEVAAQLPAGFCGRDGLGLGLGLCNCRIDHGHAFMGTNTHIPPIGAPVKVAGVTVGVGHVVVAARLVDCVDRQGLEKKNVR